MFVDSIKQLTIEKVIYLSTSVSNLERNRACPPLVQRSAYASAISKSHKIRALHSPIYCHLPIYYYLALVFFEITLDKSPEMRPSHGQQERSR
jgi:hypothetical protein